MNGYGGKILGSAVAAVLIADIAVAVCGAHVTRSHPTREAVRFAPQAAVASAPVVVQTVSQRPTGLHRGAARRVAAAVATQAAQRPVRRHTATHPATHAAAPAVRSGSHVGTQTRTVRSDATTPGVKRAEVGTVTTGALVSGSAPKGDLARVPTLTYLATMRHRAAGFKSATAKHPSMRVPRNWYGRTSVLPIVDATTKRVEVRLARRPNESTTWLKLKAVNLGYSTKAIVIDLSQRRLYVFNSGKQKYSFPIGIGRPQTPTPTGTYFLAFHAPPNSPEYGSVMLETSAHSTVFRTFEGGNDAIIAIHGPIGSDAAIGTNGAAISNGCIRMHNSQLVKAARAEDGSPIIIVH